MYVVLVEQCMYIIFQGPKPITLCGLIGSKFNSIVRFSEDLFTKCHHHFKMKHFNQSWHGRLVYINEGHTSKDTQHFPVHLQNFVLSFYFIFWYFEVLTFCTGLYFLFQFPALFKAVIQNPQLLSDFVFICYYIKDGINGCQMLFHKNIVLRYIFVGFRLL